jgi:hypothetical protein
MLQAGGFLDTIKLSNSYEDKLDPMFHACAFMTSNLGYGIPWGSVGVKLMADTPATGWLIPYHINPFSCVNSNKGTIVTDQCMKISSI